MHEHYSFRSFYKPFQEKSLLRHVGNFDMSLNELPRSGNHRPYTTCRGKETLANPLLDDSTHPRSKGYSGDWGLVLVPFHPIVLSDCHFLHTNKELIIAAALIFKGFAPQENSKFPLISPAAHRLADHCSLLLHSLHPLSSSRTLLAPLSRENQQVYDSGSLSVTT